MAKLPRRQVQDWHRSRSFIAYLTPLATHALRISTPSSGLPTGNTTILCTAEQSDPNGPLSLFISRNGNSTAVLIAGNVPLAHHADAVSVPVTVPTGLSGGGWKIIALSSDGSFLAQSPIFAIRDTPEGKQVGGAIIGAVLAVMAGLVLLGLAFFLLCRRRQRKMPPSHAYDLEVALQKAKDAPDGQPPSFGPPVKVEITEADKAEWERELDEQFSRARAGTPGGLYAYPVVQARYPPPLTPQRAVRGG